MYSFLYSEEYTQEIEVENVGEDDGDLKSVDGQKNVNDQVSVDGDDDDDENIESVDGEENVRMSGQ